MTSIFITVLGRPPRKNARGTIVALRGRPRRMTPVATIQWVKRLRSAVPPEHLGACHRGRWQLEVIVYERRMRHLDVLVPHGDVDSSVSIILDALQPSVLDDDARVVRAILSKSFDAAEPRVEITLTRAP